MVIIFDLDDTLYDEGMFVDGGLRAVAEFGKGRFGWDPDRSFQCMKLVLKRAGRGAVFDRWLAEFGEHSQKLVQQCIQVYRYHEPQLRLFDEARALLPKIANHPLYLVTDGHKIVQSRKIEALKINKYFRHFYITHRHGIRHAKPSTYCFERIKRSVRCEWSDMIYVGDNPTKDFVNLNPLSVHTVRVLTGLHREVKAPRGYDARHTIGTLDQFRKLLESLKC